MQCRACSCYPVHAQFYWQRTGSDHQHAPRSRYHEEETSENQEHYQVTATQCLPSQHAGRRNGQQKQFCSSHTRGCLLTKKHVSFVMEMKLGRWGWIIEMVFPATETAKKDLWFWTACVSDVSILERPSLWPQSCSITIVNIKNAEAHRDSDLVHRWLCHWLGFFPNTIFFFTHQRKKTSYWQACWKATFKHCTRPWRNSFQGQVNPAGHDLSWAQTFPILGTVDSELPTEQTECGPH